MVTSRILDLALRASILFVIVGGASAFSLESSRSLPERPARKLTLANGLEVVVYEVHSSPLIAVDVWYHVGSKNQQRGRTGLAHLLEHLMFQGSANYNKEYFTPLKEIGATEINATTESDRTNFFQIVPTNALERVLWLESDRMGFLEQALTQDKLDAQRRVIENERHQQIDDQPYGAVDQLIRSTLYPVDHPYSWDTLESVDDLAHVTLEDVKS